MTCTPVILPVHVLPAPMSPNYAPRIQHPPIAFSHFARVNDINMMPFIDVMLVLLIVFMMSLPVINHAVKVNLPKANASVMDKDPQAIDISVLADGCVARDKQPVDDTTLKSRLEETAKTSLAAPLAYIRRQSRRIWPRRFCDDQCAKRWPDNVRLCC